MEPSRTTTILIIDDHVTNLKVAMNHLKAYGFVIVTARDGETGIERAQFAQPDLILLDVQMGGIDGFETCRRLKAHPATSAIPVLLMTVLAETSDKVRGLESGAVDYITKPIEATELLARVNTHLRLRALSERLEELVRARTAALEEEIVRRTQYQAEKEGLLVLVRQQSEQLRKLTGLLLESQDAQQDQLQTSNRQLERNLAVLETQLAHARQLLAEPQPQLADLISETVAQAEAAAALVRQQSLQIQAQLDQSEAAQHHVRSDPLLKLSDREYEIFQLLVQGKTNAEIAETLYLAKTTVSTYQRRILEKLNVEDPASLIAFVAR